MTIRAAGIGLPAAHRQFQPTPEQQTCVPMALPLPIGEIVAGAGHHVTHMSSTNRRLDPKAGQAASYRSKWHRHERTAPRDRTNRRRPAARAQAAPPRGQWSASVNCSRTPIASAIILASLSANRRFGPRMATPQPDPLTRVRSSRSRSGLIGAGRADRM